jgi:hypothetical protein
VFGKAPPVAPPPQSAAARAREAALRDFLLSPAAAETIAAQTGTAPHFGACQYVIEAPVAPAPVHSHANAVTTTVLLEHATAERIVRLHRQAQLREQLDHHVAASSMDRATRMRDELFSAHRATQAVQEAEKRAMAAEQQAARRAERERGVQRRAELLKFQEGAAAQRLVTLARDAAMDAAVAQTARQQEARLREEQRERRATATAVRLQNQRVASAQIEKGAAARAATLERDRALLVPTELRARIQPGATNVIRL